MGRLQELPLPAAVSELRQQILSTAKALLMEQGYHGLSMREIAQSVGVSKAALYYHFQDKEQLLLAILDTALGEYEALVEQARRQAGGCRGQVSWLIEAILSQPAEQRAVIRLASQEAPSLSEPARQTFKRAYHTRFIARIQLLFADGIENGELQPVDPGVAAWALLGLLYPYFYPAHTAGMPLPGQLAGQLAGILLDGLASRPGAIQHAGNRKSDHGST